jgi:hypothetical protein
MHWISLLQLLSLPLSSICKQWTLLSNVFLVQNIIKIKTLNIPKDTQKSLLLVNSQRQRFSSKFISKSCSVQNMTVHLIMFNPKRQLVPSYSWIKVLLAQINMTQRLIQFNPQRQLVPSYSWIKVPLAQNNMNQRLIQFNPQTQTVPSYLWI